MGEVRAEGGEKGENKKADESKRGMLPCFQRITQSLEHTRPLGNLTSQRALDQTPQETQSLRYRENRDSCRSSEEQITRNAIKALFYYIYVKNTPCCWLTQLLNWIYFQNGNLIKNC